MSTAASTTTSSNRFPIVGIGASAGGFDALRRLLLSMPDDPPLAIVIVQHLARDRPSLAPELLAKYTSMQLHEVDDEPVVKPGHVYLIPPGKYLRIGGGRLHLSQMEGPRGTLVTIDYFLRSLAHDQQHCAVGVILSGSGSDGTLGIKAIKEAGGFVIAQQVDSAEQTGMPESAIRTGLVDRVLTPEQIPDVLVHLARHDYVCQTSGIADTTEPHDSEDEPSTHDSNVGLQAIIEIVRKKTGRDFSSYKLATLLRRSRRRMCLHHTDDFARYAEILERDDTEVRSLARDLLISVTDFFRDREAWEQLTQDVLPKIIATKDGTSLEGSKNDPGNTVRIWVPGCATGEEAYTVAMLALDEIKRQEKLTHLQVFASDIDRAALRTAREGRYPTSIAADLSTQQLHRHFNLRDGDVHYQVNQALRDVVTFAEQDLIGDPPFSQLDLVCCRNVLIYLQPSIQTKVLELFHFALRCDGYLMLGTAETIGRQEELFAPISKRWRIYRASGPKRPDRLPFPVGVGRSSRDLPITTAATQDSRGMHLTQQRMLQLVAPRGILVDREMRILYISGDVDDYLTFQSGIPSDDLLGKVRDGLRSRLRVAIQTSFAEQRDVAAEARLLGAEKTRPVRVEVRHLRERQQSGPMALILFDPPVNSVSGLEPQRRGTEISDGAGPPHDPSPAPAPAGDTFNPIDEHEIIHQLEQELIATKADLCLTIEQFESSNEEFKASTEEVMSVNEELQSTNEELETSKEELQSLNEELSTVNLQLAAKVGELETKHADLENLISATKVATICLDTELLIRWFTEAAGDVVRIKPADIGRPLSDLQHDFAENDFVSECREVLKSLTPIDREIRGVDGRTFIRRIVPYRTDPRQIGGLVITIVDISSRVAREAELWAGEEKLRLAAEAARLGWYSYDVERDQSVWSKELRAIVGLDDNQKIDLERAMNLVHPDDRQAIAKRVQDALSTPRNSEYRSEFRCIRSDGELVWLEDRGKVIWNESSAGDPRPLHAVGMAMDITERKAIEAQLAQANHRLEQQVADRTSVLETLQKVTRIANESVSIQATMQAVLQQLAEYNGYKIGHVHLTENKQVETRASGDSTETESDTHWYIQDEQASVLARLRDVHDHSGLLAKLRQQVVSTGLPSWIGDLEAETGGDELVSLGIRSLIFAPVCFQQEVVAVLVFFGNEAETPAETFRELLLDAGIQLGHAIERQRLQKVVGSIADEEQRRIGRELHDTIAQQLTGGALVAKALKGSLNEEEAERHQTIDQLIDIFSTSHRSVRELSAGLMHNTARSDNLVAVLQGLCDEAARRFEVGCELLTSEFDPAEIQNNNAAIAIAQIAREAIHNSVKHAAATQIDVELVTHDDGVRLVVSDDGVGMSAVPADRSSNGLRIMRFRADSLGGDLEIIMPDTGGTSVILTLPKSSLQP